MSNIQYILSPYILTEHFLGLTLDTEIFYRNSYQKWIRLINVPVKHEHNLYESEKGRQAAKIMF